MKELDSEVYSFALKTTLTEIQKICPDIKNCFIFKEDGQIIAKDEGTSKKVVEQVLDSFNDIMNDAKSIGGIEGITLEGSKSRVDISLMSDIYLFTVTSQQADLDYLNTVTRVLVPTVLKLLDKINPASLKNKIIEEKETIEEITEELETEEPEEPEEPKKEEIEDVPSEPPVNQLIIEELGGLLVPSDTVRVDSRILSQWEDFSKEFEEIEEVEIETFGGKSTRCKVKPIKDSKYENKGIIRMPEKIQQNLGIKKGELVRVKPVID